MHIVGSAFARQSDLTARCTLFSVVGMVTGNSKLCVLTIQQANIDQVIIE